MTSDLTANCAWHSERLIMHVSNSRQNNLDNILRNEDCTEDTLVVDYSDFSRIELFAKYLQPADQHITMEHKDGECDEKRDQRANYFVDDTGPAKSADIFNDVFDQLEFYTTNTYSNSFDAGSYKAGYQFVLKSSGVEKHDLVDRVELTGMGAGFNSKQLTEKLFDGKCPKCVKIFQKKYAWKYI